MQGHHVTLACRRRSAGTWMALHRRKSHITRPGPPAVGTLHPGCFHGSMARQRQVRFSTRRTPAVHRGGAKGFGERVPPAGLSKSILTVCRGQVAAEHRAIFIRGIMKKCGKVSGRGRLGRAWGISVGGAAVSSQNQGHQPIGHQQRTAPIASVGGRGASRTHAVSMQAQAGRRRPLRAVRGACRLKEIRGGWGVCR